MTKSERMTNDEIRKERRCKNSMLRLAGARRLRFSDFGFLSDLVIWISSFFRISSFGFRISFALPSRPVDDSPGFGAGMLAIFEHPHTVDEHIARAGRILMRFFKCRVVRNSGRVEDHHIGEVGRLKRASLFELQLLG